MAIHMLQFLQSMTGDVSNLAGKGHTDKPGPQLQHTQALLWNLNWNDLAHLSAVFAAFVQNLKSMLPRLPNLAARCYNCLKWSSTAAILAARGPSVPSQATTQRERRQQERQFPTSRLHADYKVAARAANVGDHLHHQQQPKTNPYSKVNTWLHSPFLTNRHCTARPLQV